MTVIHKEKVKFQNVYHQDNNNIVHLDGDFDYVVETNESNDFCFSLKNKDNDTILYSDLQLILGKYLEYCLFAVNDEKYVFILVKEEYEELVEEKFDNSSECLVSHSILGFDGTLINRGLDYDPSNHEYQEYLFQLPSTFDEDVVINALSSVGMTYNEKIRDQISCIFSFD